MGMIFELPIKYLYDIHTNELLRDNLKALSFDLGFDMEGDLLEEGFNNVDEFVHVLYTHSPEGHFTYEDGIISMDLYDYWDHEFYNFHNYCDEKQIPYNYYRIPDSQTECPYYEFRRPGWISSRSIDANEHELAVVPIHHIMNAINDQDEELTDLEVLIKLTREFEDMDPYSIRNHLRNWA